MNAPHLGYIKVCASFRGHAPPTSDLGRHNTADDGKRRQNQALLQMINTAARETPHTQRRGNAPSLSVQPGDKPTRLQAVSASATIASYGCAAINHCIGNLPDCITKSALARYASPPPEHHHSHARLNHAADAKACYLTSSKRTHLNQIILNFHSAAQ